MFIIVPDMMQNEDCKMRLHWREFNCRCCNSRTSQLTSRFFFRTKGLVLIRIYCIRLRENHLEERGKLESCMKAGWYHGCIIEVFRAELLLHDRKQRWRHDTSLHAVSSLIWFSKIKEISSWTTLKILLHNAASGENLQRVQVRWIYTSPVPERPPRGSLKK